MAGGSGTKPSGWKIGSFTIALDASVVVTDVRIVSVDDGWVILTGIRSGS